MAAKMRKTKKSKADQSLKIDSFFKVIIDAKNEPAPKKKRTDVTSNYVNDLENRIGGIFFSTFSMKISF